MGKKCTVIGYCDDEKKRKAYYTSKKFKNLLKKLVAGSIMTKYKYFLTIVNPDENRLITYSNMTKPEFKNEESVCKKSGSVNELEIYNENNYHSSFSDSVLSEKKMKNSKSESGSSFATGKKSKSTSTKQSQNYSDDEESEEETDTSPPISYNYISNIETSNRISKPTVVWDRFDAN